MSNSCSLMPLFRRIGLVLGVLTLSAEASSSETAEPLYLRAGDRVVFYGDSITEQAHYTLPIEVYLSARHPELGVTFVNSGWGGDCAWGGEGGTLAERLKRDVLAYKPTVVTVMLGMNDGYYTDFDQKSLDAFRESLGSLVRTLKRESPGIRITLLGTSPYDNITPGERPDWEAKIDGGYDSVIAHYSRGMREVAKQHGLLFVDMHEPLAKLIRDLQEKQPELARELIPDRIHPGKAGGLVMAAELLSAWNAPRTNSITIDGSTLKEDPLILRQRLPARFALEQDPLTKYLLSNVVVLRLFSTPMLRITSLPAGKTLLRIDGHDLGTFTESQLDNGIELTERVLPVNSTDRLGRLIEQRSRLHFIRERHLEFHAKGQPELVKLAIVELADVEREFQGLQNDLANSNSHVIELVPANR